MFDKRKKTEIGRKELNLEKEIALDLESLRCLKGILNTEVFALSAKMSPLGTDVNVICSESKWKRMQDAIPDFTDETFEEIQVILRKAANEVGEVIKKTIPCVDLEVVRNESKEKA